MADEKSRKPKSTTSRLQAFAQDVKQGLSQLPKKLPSKYFYDSRGDQLFQEIMHMPNYYLSRCEYAIFKKHRAHLLAPFETKDFDLVELGAGDGWKTQLLLAHLLDREATFRYLPIDISKNALDTLEESLLKSFPALRIKSIHDEYFHALHELRELETRPKLILFLGSNIGNFNQEQALVFLRQLAEDMDQNDRLLIGIDLKKDPQVIRDAYDDETGITAAFNLNLLERINRELEGNFQLDHFSHWESYNPVTGDTRSFLISRKAQEVTIRKLDQTFSFQAWEAIDVELSKKYSLPEIKALAHEAGFEICQNHLDERAYFVDSLWKVRQD